VVAFRDLIVRKELFTSRLVGGVCALKKQKSSPEQQAVFLAKYKLA
jgi:hypothetical protein